MDYNDNDYESHNLYLAGEESSKLSSVLRPFALPKYDFDDSLHGQLRFDSLVENEVFLGIPSQEENQWIVDFSRGNSGIEFSSAGAESCALPTRNNVWSEATSSESVEMLLKAVGQEEMPPGDNTTEKSDQGEQQDSSTRKMDNNLKQDGENDVVAIENSSLLLSNAQAMSLNMSERPEDVNTDYTLQAQETNFSSYEQYLGSKEGNVTVASENSYIDIKGISDIGGETCGVVNAHVHNQEIGDNGCTSPEIAGSTRESVCQGKMSDTGFVSSSSVAAGLSDAVEEHKECCNKDKPLSRAVTETDMTGMHSSPEMALEMESSKEEQIVELGVTNPVEAAIIAEKGKFVSKDDRCHEDAFIVELEGGSECGTVVLSSGTGMLQTCEALTVLYEKTSVSLNGGSSDWGLDTSEGDLVMPTICGDTELKQAGSECGTVVFSSGTGMKQTSEALTVLYEKTSVSLNGGSSDGGLDTSAGDLVTSTICGDTELKQAPVMQPSELDQTLVGDGIHPGSNSCLENLHATFESSMFHEVLGHPPEKDSERNISHAGGSSTGPTHTTYAGEYCGQQSVVNVSGDARDAVVPQKENLANEDHASHPLVSGSVQKCTESIIPMQVDARESDLDVSACEEEENNVNLDPSDMVCDGKEKGVGSTFSCDGPEVNDETCMRSQQDDSGGHPVLNAEFEHTKLISSHVEGDESVKSCDHISPSCTMGYKDQSNETESEAPEKLSNSVPNKSMEMIMLTPIEIEKDAHHDSSTTGGTKTNDQSVSSVETSCVATPDISCKELNEKMQRPADDLSVQDDGVKAACTENPMGAEIDRSCGTKSSTDSVTICSAEINKVNQFNGPGDGCTDSFRSGISKQESVKRNIVEDISHVLPTPVSSGINASAKEDSTFTFNISFGDQSTGDSGNGVQSFPRIQACKVSMTGEGLPSRPNSDPEDLIKLKETSFGTLSPLDCPSSVSLEGTSNRRTKRGSTKSGKGNAKKGIQVQETMPLKRTEMADKSSVSLSPFGSGKHMKFESIVNPRGAASIPTSSLPDLNSSAPSPGLFQQPFTDSQQVQLRAQIFVYGSLIQGAAPDEACMVSAFGMSDGGRSRWEPFWRTCVERLRNQKSQANNNETPVHSRSDAGVRTPGPTHRQGSEALSSVPARAGNKAVSSPVCNSVMTLTSPLWNISTPSSQALPSSSIARGAVFDYKAFSPLHPYQTPPIRNFPAHTTWPSQTSFPVPWHASSQSSPYEAGSNYPTFPIMEPVKLAPVKEQSLPITSGAKQASVVPTTHIGAASMFVVDSSTDSKEVKVSTGQTSGDKKIRKRKKSSGVEDTVQNAVTASLPYSISAPVVANHLLNVAPAVDDLSQISSIARNQAELVSRPVVSSHYSTTVSVTTPNFVPKGTTNQLVSVAPPEFSGDHLKRGVIVDKLTRNMEGFSKVEEAKLQAQEAAANAAIAISQCQDVWGKLDKQKNSGLTSDVESKVASAAAAIAAAASVSKAAAAAAKIAANAAVQAKQMMDEAVANSETVNKSEHGVNSVSNSMSNLVSASPVAILTVGDRSNAPSYLALSAAKEASRKRVEAASFATRHAENLDAIVKAAELAAEAVSHAGKIVAMGDPVSLAEMVKAGPDRYWKDSPSASVPSSKSIDMSKNEFVNSNAGVVPNDINDQHEVPDKDVHTTSHALPSLQRHMADDHVAEEASLTASIKHLEKSFEKGKGVSESAKDAGCVSGLDNESRSSCQLPRSYKVTSSIKEGSLVEVLKDHGDLKKAWYSASVLTLKDGEALVSYTELQSDEGTEQLKEWVSLEGKDGIAPKVRIPHPMTAVQYEETRKRSRAAIKDYAWSVGDKVDAWVRDSWCEGIIAEKNTKDTTTLTVHFPDQGDKLMVKMWHLRPTLIWSDGQWIEWCRPRQDGTSEGDTPLEKRPKLGSIVGCKKKGQMAIDYVETGTRVEPRLPLSDNERVFNIGNLRDENKPNMVKKTSSGLEKGGSRVVFGVPKPAKKRKFMEVSKHYISDRSMNTNVPDDSVKLAKFLMPQPQGSGSRGVKNNPKHDLKEKHAGESKVKAVKSRKPPIPSRGGPRKEAPSSRPNARDASLSVRRVQSGSVSNNDNDSDEPSLAEFGSFSNIGETSGDTMVPSSQAVSLENRKKASTRSDTPDQFRQGKFAANDGDSEKNGGDDKLISDVAEPRRSNRRIQPTSRLLEGLQSSIAISKFPSSSHPKGHRSISKSSTKGSRS